MEELARPVNFANTFSACFTLFTREQLAKLGASLNQFVANCHEHLKASLKWRIAPVEYCAISGFKSRLNLRRIGLRVDPDDVVTVRGTDVIDIGVARCPLSVNVEVMLLGHLRILLIICPAILI